ncbi:MAG: phospho-sugar mutase [Spirochaetia bacterium]|jgi:phosphoglucomutase|nr:phospho-sugar mutase [Spirochaetia bacterium]
MDKKELDTKISDYLKFEEHPHFLNDLQQVVENKNIEELNDRFYMNLEFGTGGLRGVIGGGYNRINPYIIRKSTTGLANYINKMVKDGSVAIAYDSRNFSKIFAEEAALVLCAKGIKVYLFTSLRPTPVVSYTVRKLGCTAGIVVTASHNPAEYNGYKVYWSDGGQIVPPHDVAIINEVNTVTGKVKTMNKEKAIEQGVLIYTDKLIDEPYIELVKSCSFRPELMKAEGKNLKVVYTPLHGAGTMLVERTLGEMGIDVITVPEQREPDGDFPTVAFPNPEIVDAMKLGLELARKEKADILLGTDPDADRLGIAVPDGEKYVLVTGNQLGVLLGDYIFSSQKESGSLNSKSAFVKTIVTTELQRLVAMSYGVTSYDVLTGFKYIAEKIKEFEKTGEKYIFGGEESYGYLVTDEVRDKDAVSAAFLTVELTLYHRSRGKSVLDRLKEIWEEFGYFEELLISRYLKGEKGKAQMSGMMSSMRTSPPAEFGGISVSFMKDYKTGETYNLKTGKKEKNINLPPSNVLQFVLEEGSMVTIRPSGTEPKIKFYASCKAEPGKALETSKKEVSIKLKRIEEDVDEFLG